MDKKASVNYAKLYLLFSFLIIKEFMGIFESVKNVIKRALRLVSNCQCCCRKKNGNFGKSVSFPKVKKANNSSWSLKRRTKHPGLPFVILLSIVSLCLYIWFKRSTGEWK